MTNSHEINAGEKANFQTVGQVLGCHVNQSWKDFAFNCDKLSSSHLEILNECNTGIRRALGRISIIASIIRRPFGIA